MTETYSIFETWLIIFLAALATFGWRFSGLILADYIKSDSIVMRWVNCIAYAMVASVLMRLLVFPGGVLATTSLDHRLAGLAVGLLLMLSLHKLWLSLIVAMGTFAVLVTAF